MRVHTQQQTCRRPWAARTGRWSRPRTWSAKRRPPRRWRSGSPLSGTARPATRCRRAGRASTGRPQPRRRRTGRCSGRGDGSSPSRPGCGTSRSTGPSRTRLLGPAVSLPDHRRPELVRPDEAGPLLADADRAVGQSVPAAAAELRRDRGSRSSPGCACSTSATRPFEPGVRRQQVGAAGFGVTGLLLEEFSNNPRPGSRSPAGVGPGGSRTPGRRHRMPRSRPCREGRSPGRPSTLSLSRQASSVPAMPAPITQTRMALLAPGQSRAQRAGVLDAALQQGEQAADRQRRGRTRSAGARSHRGHVRSRPGPGRVVRQPSCAPASNGSTRSANARKELKVKSLR